MNNKMPKIGDVISTGEGLTVLVEELEGQDPEKPGRGFVNGVIVLNTNTQHPLDKLKGKIKIPNYEIRDVRNYEKWKYDQSLLANKNWHLCKGFKESLEELQSIPAPDFNIPENVKNQVEVCLVREHEHGLTVMIKDFQEEAYGILWIREGKISSLPASPELFGSMFTNQDLMRLVARQPSSVTSSTEEWKYLKDYMLKEADYCET